MTAARAWSWGRIAAVVAAVVAVWIAAGIRRVDPQTEFAVVERPFVGPTRVDGRWALAPPLLFDSATYPSIGVEIPLPQAAELGAQAADGSLFGLRGFVTLRARPEGWRELHAAADGAGLRGALGAATREAVARLTVRRGRPLTAPMRSEIEERLRAALAERGLDLRSLALSSLDFLAAADGGEAPPTDTKLLIVGWDGADWNIVDGLIQQGRLPNLERLVDRGVRAKLLSISPMLSPVVWTSAATGVEPTRHNILDFLVEDPETGARQPVTAAQRRAPTFWEMLSARGVTVGVTGWWATWPADPVEGYLISDRLAYQLFGYRSDPADAEGKSWPPELYDEIRSLIVEPRAIGWERVEGFLGGSRRERSEFDAEEREMLDELRTLIAAGESYLEIGLELRERFRPQLEIAYFEGTDTIGHLFMPYRLPALDGVPPERIASFAPMVDRYYELADDYLGRLLEGKGEDWTVMLISDHGFASDTTRPRTTDSRIGHGGAADWHRRFGLFVLAGRHVRGGATLDEASIYDIAPTVLALYGQPVPSSWPGRVLGDALEPEFLAAHPVRFTDEEPQRQGLAGGAALEDPAAAELMERLQSLGYISTGGSGGEARDSATARNNEGIALMAQGEFAEAERLFREGIAESGESPMFLFNLALAVRFQARTEEAETLLRRAMTSPSALQMSGIVLGEMLVQEGRFDEARGVVDRVLEFEPDSQEALTLSGRIFEAAGDDAAAIERFRRAAELDPDAAMPRNHLGTASRRAGDLAEAERWYLAAIEADPYFMGAYNNLALVYQELGEIGKAIDLYNRALTKAPDNAIVLNNLASLYFATGDNGRAREQWERAVEADPDYASPLNNLAGLAMTEGDVVEAERLLGRALILDPNYGDARINLAIVHDRRGEIEAAREQLVLATADPRSVVSSWVQLGSFELKHGESERAIEALEQAVRLLPNRVQPLNMLGEAYRRAGRDAAAAEAWRRSLRLQPGQRQIEQALRMLPES